MKKINAKNYNYQTSEEVHERNYRISLQHLMFMIAEKRFIPFKEYKAFLDYLSEKIIEDSNETRSVKSVDQYFQNWMSGDRDIYYHDVRKMTIAEMDEYFNNCNLNGDYSTDAE